MWPFTSKERAVTLADWPALQEKVMAEMAREDALIDEYLALPDRPRPLVMMSVYEGGEKELTESIDVEDWARWRLGR